MNYMKAEWNLSFRSVKRPKIPSRCILYLWKGPENGLIMWFIHILKQCVKNSWKECKVLICGIYHSPKTMYNETELIHYQTDIMDDFLKAHPNGLVVYGGDLIVILLQYLLVMFVSICCPSFFTTTFKWTLTKIVSATT